MFEPAQIEVYEEGIGAVKAARLFVEDEQLVLKLCIGEVEPIIIGIVLRVKTRMARDKDLVEENMKRLEDTSRFSRVGWFRPTFDMFVGCGVVWYRRRPMTKVLEASSAKIYLTTKFGFTSSKQIQLLPANL